MVATYPRTVTFTSPVSQVRAAAAKRYRKVYLKSVYTKHARFIKPHYRPR